MADEYFEPEVYTLTDEDGNESDYSELGVAEIDGKTYHAMIPIDADGNEIGDEYIILYSEVDENGEEYLTTIEDDEEFDRIADIFDDEFAEIDYDQGGEDK